MVQALDLLETYTAASVGRHHTWIRGDTLPEINWRASEASETLSGVYKFELMVMWVELGHCYFLYVLAVLNVVTIGNGTGTKNVLKWNHALGFEFSIQSSVYGATTEVKVSLLSTWTRCTVSFYSM